MQKKATLVKCIFSTTYKIYKYLVPHTIRNQKPDRRRK